MGTKWSAGTDLGWSTLGPVASPSGVHMGMLLRIDYTCFPCHLKANKCLNKIKGQEGMIKTEVIRG